MEIVTRWFGVFAVEEGRVVAARPFPAAPTAIKERWLQRARGELTEEERELWGEITGRGASLPTSRDGRFMTLGARPSFGFLPNISPQDHGIQPEWERQILLETGREGLIQAVDPSLHVGEAIRAISDLEGTLNLLGERLVNWWVDETPTDSTRPGENALAAARRILADESNAPIPRARRALARLVVDVSAAMQEMEAAVESEAAASLPNLTLLLGPMLTARLVAQAGGIARLSRLPSSTVQVLGAERAFFDHLRTGHPSPKYGLIFLHPLVLGAPSRVKGRMARTLSGKISIAARRDFAHSPPIPDLRETLEKRFSEMRKREE